MLFYAQRIGSTTILLECYDTSLLPPIVPTIGALFKEGRSSRLFLACLFCPLFGISRSGLPAQNFHSDRFHRAHALDLHEVTGSLALYVSPLLDLHMIVELELQQKSAVVIFVIPDGGLLASLIRSHAVAMDVLSILEGTLVGLVCIEIDFLLRDARIVRFGHF